MLIDSVSPQVLLLLAGGPALLHARAAVLADRGTREAAWRRAEHAALAAAACGALAVAAACGVGDVRAAGLRLDLPGALAGWLVGFVGWAIVRFSARYLQGEAGDRRYLRLLSATLAAVVLVIAADHLVLMAAAWAATSVSMHRLLRFYDGRPAARQAAHKKFLAARAADVSLAAAVALLGAGTGTLSLGDMAERVATQGVPALAQAGLALLAVTVLLKCAQLPLHGWLLQVMEAPTPVSALLHAGVVNLGGLVLVRFSPLLAHAPVALGLLGTVATATVVVATLAAGTRVSIKVALAWSTVAQMGYMVLEVALGLPAMAMLHLLAHSLYKAHAFLSAGGVVQRQQALRLAPAPASGSAASPLRTAASVAAAGALPAAIVAAGAWSGTLSTPGAWLAGAVLGLSVAPLAAAGRLAPAGAVVGAWAAGHALLSAAIHPAAFDVPVALPAGVAVALAALFAVQAAVARRPDGAFARRLYPWAYAGFHVDDWASGLLLRRWPVPGPATPARPAPALPLAGARQ